MNPIAFTIFGRAVYWYGIIISVALVLGIWLALRNAKKRGIQADHMMDLVVLAVPLAIVGARLVYVMGTWSEFAGRPFWHVFAVWEGGLAIFGAVLGGALGVWLFCRWRKYSFLQMADIAVISLILGQALGRWGNFFNQEVYGFAVQNVRGIIGGQLALWPPAVPITSITGITTWHLALFLIECVLNLGLFGLLLSMNRKKRPLGVLFFTYITGYGLIRVVLESFRDPLYVERIGTLRLNHCIAALFLVGGVAGLLWTYMKTRRMEPALASPEGEAQPFEAPLYEAVDGEPQADEPPCDEPGCCEGQCDVCPAPDSEE